MATSQNTSTVNAHIAESKLKKSQGEVRLLSPILPGRLTKMTKTKHTQRQNNEMLKALWKIQATKYIWRLRAANIFFSNKNRSI